MAGQRRVIRKLVVISDSAIMGNVAIGHDIIEIAYLGTFIIGRSMDSEKFAQHVSLTDNDRSAFAMKVGMLRSQAETYKGIDLVSRTDAKWSPEH